MSFNSTTTNDTQVIVPCTIDTCPLSYAFITYQPNIGGNAFFVALFGVFLLVQLFLGIRYKTWTYLVAMTFGLILEVIGYIGRLQLHNDPFYFTFFLEYLVCLTIAPAFLTAAIYITFARIAYCCDETLSLIRPKTISIIFMTCDFVCLVLQAAGGAITSTSNGESQETADTRQTGVNIMIAAIHSSRHMRVSGGEAWSLVRSRASNNSQQSAHASLRWRSLVFGLAIASVTIFVRCVFRVAELREGFQSPLANDEVAFMILEGTMIIIACLCLTLGHPGLCLDIPWKHPKQVSPRKPRDAVSNSDLENMDTTQ